MVEFGGRWLQRGFKALGTAQAEKREPFAEGQKGQRRKLGGRDKSR
jgi:hypothetical protein